MVQLPHWGTGGECDAGKGRDCGILDQVMCDCGWSVYVGEFCGELVVGDVQEKRVPACQLMCIFESNMKNYDRRYHSVL